MEKEKTFICITECEDLDCLGDEHCTSSQKDLDEGCTCPCHLEPKWVEKINAADLKPGDKLINNHNGIVGGIAEVWTNDITGVKKYLVRYQTNKLLAVTADDFDGPIEIILTTDQLQAYIDRCVVIPKIKNPNQKLICVAKCPELDCTNNRHCIDTEKGIKVIEEHRDYCPCGNVAKWAEYQDNTAGGLNK